MKNPYEVLGISPNATDAEVKAAYRAMAKKYHPDNYADSPLGELAEQKMKEINEAYDTITEMRKNGASSSSAGGYSGYSAGANTGFYNVRVYIQNGRLHDAEAILDSTPANQRNAEWYFLKGMVYYRKGWGQQAYSYFQTAHSMDPDNTEYAQAFNRINMQRTSPVGGYSTNTVGSECTICDICNAMMCANCCCNCMGRGC